jgi:transposase
MSKHEPLVHDWREWRRRRAWYLYEQGWQQRDIAQALGVSKGAVSQWITKAKQEGTLGLRRQPRCGRSSKLSPEQRAQLPDLLAKGAEVFGFSGAVWTTERVAHMIKQQFGVSYHPAHCSRLVRACHSSQQKPIEKATQRDEQRIEDWKREQWPALKKSERGGANDPFCG